MPQSVFGTGNLFTIPTGANPTPNRVGALQDVSVDFSFDMKQLYGGAQFPLEQARGKGKIDLKATAGRFDPVMFNNIVFGLTTTTGEALNSVDESATPSAGTFTVANGGTFSVDLGVYNTVTKLYMTRVASAPSTGQYAVNVATGVYTTNTAQNGQLLRVSYTYTSSSTGTKLAYTNQLMGSNIVFGLELVNSYVGADNIKRSLLLHFPAVQCPKLSIPMKLDDFSLPQLEMHAQDDGSGNVFDYSMTG